jgi:small subunit ribosomal protein S17
MASETTADRGKRKTFSGIVISDRMAKTRVVSVARLVRHPFYEKVMKKSSRFSVHDESNQSRQGDLVEIMGCRPLSRTKRWRLVRVIKAAPRLAAAPVAKGAEAKS